MGALSFYLTFDPVEIALITLCLKDLPQIIVIQFEAKLNAALLLRDSGFSLILHQEMR